MSVSLHRDAIKLNESGGKLFELLSEISLINIFGRKKVISQPKGSVLDIEPDVFIGTVKNPTHLVLISHATAKNAAGVKVDRNIEELFEAKTRFNKFPVTLNLIWHSPIGWSEGHIARLDEMFDCNWVAFRDCPGYEKALPSMIKISKELEGIERDDAMRIALKSHLANLFTPSIKKCLLSKSKNKNSEIWALEKKRAGNKLTVKYEYAVRVKEDLIAACLIDVSYIPILLEGKGIKMIPEMTPAINSGAIEQRISLRGNLCFLNTDLRNRLIKLSETIGEAGIISLIKEVGNSEGYSHLASVYEDKSLATKRIKNVRTAAKQGALKDFIDNSLLIKNELFNGRCWPLYTASAIIKAKVNEDFGFLYAQRSVLGDTNDSYKWDILTRYALGEKDILSSDQLVRIAGYFEVLLNQVEAVSDTELLDDIKYWQEVEINKNKKGNPLPWLVRRTLLSHNIRYRGFPEASKVSYCPFIQKAGGKKITGMTRWHFITEKGDILHILTNYSTTHKDKEYSAKSRISNYEYRGGHFIRSNIRDIGIILDGEWSSGQLSLFASAGVKTFSADDPSAWISWINR